MVIMASGIARGRSSTHDGTGGDADGDEDGVAQHGGHAPNNRLTEIYSLGYVGKPWFTDIGLLVYCTEL